ATASAVGTLPMQIAFRGGHVRGSADSTSRHTALGAIMSVAADAAAVSERCFGSSATSGATMTTSPPDASGASSSIADTSSEGGAMASATSRDVIPTSSANADVTLARARYDNSAPRSCPFASDAYRRHAVASGEMASNASTAGPSAASPASST